MLRFIYPSSDAENFFATNKYLSKNRISIYFFTLSGIKNSFSANISTKFRSSRLEVFCKKVFIETPQNSQENTCARVSFLKKRLGHRCFPVNIAKFVRTPFFKEHLWWLLLQIGKIWTVCQILLFRLQRERAISIFFLVKYAKVISWSWVIWE